MQHHQTKDALQKDAIAAFEYAIAQGRLGRDTGSPLFAGDYMWMGRNGEGWDTFKHCNTRAYLPLGHYPVRP